MGRLRDYLLRAFAANSANDRPMFYHIGLDTVNLQGREHVLWVLDDYPAWQSGIRRGDVIIAANNGEFHPVESFSSGNPLTLTIEHNGDLHNTTLKPVLENLYDSFRSATDASLMSFSSGNKIIGYVHLWSLSRNSNDLIAYLRILQNLAHCDGLVLDLRNGYGLLSPVHLLALGVEAERNSNFPLPYLEIEAFTRPVVVIINELTSGGAAELAMVLGRQERIILLGEANTDRLPGLIPGTTANLTPEVFVRFPLDEPVVGDPQIDAAVTTLLEII